MANEQDIRFAAQKCKDALQRHDLSAAKAALGELRDLAQVFAGMQGQLKEPEQNERTRELKEQAEGETEGLKRKVSEMEIDMADPDFEQRLRGREQEKAAREAADKARAAQVLQGLGGPFAALAGLANLGGPAAPPAASMASMEEVKCPSCATPHPGAPSSAWSAASRWRAAAVPAARTSARPSFARSAARRRRSRQTDRSRSPIDIRTTLSPASIPPSTAVNEPRQKAQSAIIGCSSMRT